ncbi:ATP-binding protein [Nitratidesulfovibrio termitidis]|uniref:ATP-binding protein n=1 Tax=Nitratidesulfovibrio termitidis TaxID=42252 RepID=UPI0004085881|nr:DUF87 domain-containing protein [Nitratidesulfovibrio termitidis]
MAVTQGYEQLGLFYLGRELDITDGAAARAPLLFRNKDLTTHAAIIGMTGSGKTGLGIGLIEEAIMDDIPSIIIDPKGDMANLLLTFPSLSPADFQPWVDPVEASRKGLTVEAYAAQVSKTWEEGLFGYGQAKERIGILRRKARFTLYTPGSSLGTPISVLGDFASPPADVLAEGDVLNALVGSTVTSLLSLIDVHGDPLQSREHILVSSLFLHHWRKGEGLTMESLIGGIVSPPFARIGVFPMDGFFPQNDRLALAMRLNNIIASPSFAAWTQGRPLDIQRILYDEEGRPQTAIFSIAHLSDAERMFFVTMLLNHVIAWMRRQQGTPSLKAILYMDEIFGYFPPIANPPSKRPMLVLLKQARAFGLGVVLSTQNPVDLDYKGLANIGTWFVGRLQTTQDQERVAGGIAGASDGKLELTQVKGLLARLKGRQFLLTSAHQEEPLLFETRWTMSYLKGPIAGEDIKRLALETRVTPDDVDAAVPVVASTAPSWRADDAGGAPPFVANAIEQRYYLPPMASAAPVFEPWLSARATLRFHDSGRNIDEQQDIALRLYLDDRFVRPNWAEALDIPFAEDDCLPRAPTGSRFHELPVAITRLKDMKSLHKSFSDFLYQSRQLELYRAASLKMESRPGESANDFKVRVADALRGRRGVALEALRRKYAARQKSLEQKLLAAQGRLEREQGDVQSRTADALISFGTAMIDAFFGRKTFSAGNVSRVATGFRSAGRVARERDDVQRAGEALALVQQELAELAAEIEEKARQVAEVHDVESCPIEAFAIKPRRGDIFNVRLAVLWEMVLRPLPGKTP